MTDETKEEREIYLYVPIIDCLLWALVAVCMGILFYNDYCAETTNRNLALRLADNEARLSRIENTLLWRAQK